MSRVLFLKFLQNRLFSIVSLNHLNSFGKGDDDDDEGENDDEERKKGGK